MNARVSWRRLLRGLTCGVVGVLVAAAPARAQAPLTRAAVDSVRGVAARAAVAEDTNDAPVDPRSYIVGPGDRFRVGIAGRVNQTMVLTVSPEGWLPLPNGATLDVRGQSLEVVRGRVAAATSGQILGSRVSVTLEGVRTFKVYVAGAVSTPMAVRASGRTRVSDAITLAGGSVLGAAERGIVLRHLVGDSTRVDLVSFERTGDFTFNPCLREGDVVIVPTRTATFVIDGAVAFGGTYDLQPGDDIARALLLAGGALPGARLDGIELYRFGDEGEVAPSLLDGTAPGAMARRIEDGDHIYVRRVSGYRHANVVSLTGEVLYPGNYALLQHETLASLLARAGGLTAHADSSAITIDRIELRSPAYDEVYGLSKLDPARLRDADLELTRLVGTGRGGLLTADLTAPGAERTLEVRAGDRIDVPQSTGQVRIAGEVRRPGLVPFVRDAPIRHYIDLAGGFTSRADRGHVRVSKSRGWHTVEGGDAVPVQEGDILWVMAKPRPQAWTRLRDIAGILAQLATVYLVIHTTNSSTGN